MNDQTLRFGGGAASSLVSPLVLLWMATAFILILAMQRKRLIVPLLVTTCFIPVAQQINIFGVHFMIFRVMLLASWIRVLAGGEMQPSRRFRMNALDKAVVLWAITSSIATVLLWGEFGAAVQRCGFLYDVFGFYFLFRVVLREPKDIDLAIRVFAVICVILAISMMGEQITRRNIFGLLGGVPEVTVMRWGKLRAQGPFAHPILAGTFGAILMPLFAGLWWQKRYRVAGLAGVLASVLIAIASSSSTPLLALMGGASALCLWWVRSYMRLLRWCVWFTLIGLHLVMKAPVWALIGRVDLTGGSSSSHRYELIDQAVQHVGEWWLFGTRQVSSWGFEMGDTSNQYIDYGVTGGIFSLALFVVIVVCGFRAVGKARRAVAGSWRDERRLWSLGAALFANVVAYFGISYFDQTVAVWYALLAMLAASLPDGSVAQPVAEPSSTQLEPAACGESGFGWS